MNAVPRYIRIPVLLLGALLTSCEKKEEPVIVSPWAQYDFSEQELKLLEEAAEYDEDAAHKLGMYYTGIEFDQKKMLYWERRAAELYRQNRDCSDSR